MLRFAVLPLLLACAVNGETAHEQAVECRKKINAMRKKVLERIENISRDIHISPQWGACPSGAKLGCKFSGGKAVPITPAPTPAPKLSKHKGTIVPFAWRKPSGVSIRVDTITIEHIPEDQVNGLPQNTKTKRVVKPRHRTKTPGVCRFTKFVLKDSALKWAADGIDDSLPDDACCDKCTGTQMCVQDATGCHCYETNQDVTAEWAKTVKFVGTPTHTVDSFDCHAHCGCTENQACKYDRDGCDCWEPAGVADFCGKQCAHGRRLQFDVATQASDGSDGSDTDEPATCPSGDLCHNCDAEDCDYCICDKTRPCGQCYDKPPSEGVDAVTNSQIKSEKAAVKILATRVAQMSNTVNDILKNMRHGLKRTDEGNAVTFKRLNEPWLSKVEEDGVNVHTDIVYGTLGLMARKWNSTCATQFGEPHDPVLGADGETPDFDKCCEKCVDGQACASTANGGCVCWDVNPMYEKCPAQSGSAGACDDDLPDDSCCDACTDTQMCVQDSTGCHCHDIGGDEVVQTQTDRRTV